MHCTAFKHRWLVGGDEEEASIAPICISIFFMGSTTPPLHLGAHRPECTVGDGARACAGNAFALQEAKIALARIAQRFTFHLAPGQDPLALRLTCASTCSDPRVHMHSVAVQLPVECKPALCGPCRIYHRCRGGSAQTAGQRATDFLHVFSCSFS